MDYVAPILLTIPCIILAVWCGKLADKYIKEDPWGTINRKTVGSWSYPIR